MRIAGMNCPLGTPKVPAPKTEHEENTVSAENGLRSALAALFPFFCV